MPTAQIDVRQPYTSAQEIALIEAVHAAMMEALKIPAWDRNVCLVVHEPHRFACPPNKTYPERYTLVSIDLFSGRSLDAKRRLYQTLVANLEVAVGIPPDHVLIRLREIEPENWGVRGGHAACDVDIGFKIDV